MVPESVAAPIEAFNTILRIALEEDAADRDITSALIDENAMLDARIIARERLVLAGAPVLSAAFGDATLHIEDGSDVEPGSVIATVHASARQILSRERSVLNIMGRLSGIATLTKTYVSRLSPVSKTRILDTRKTTPGLRALEKYAVRCGGGFNHRMDLSEMIFLKDNHLACLEKLPAAADIIEVDNLDDLEKYLALKPRRVLLDNFADDDIAHATAIIRERCEVEVSGGITLERINTLSRLDVDYISVGAITHSARCSDLSLEI